MTTYYVRKTGNDANGGTDPDADAVLTLAQAITISTTNDTLDFGVGTWSESFSVSRTLTGVSMFLTHISDISSTWTGLTITLSSIKVTHTDTTSYIQVSQLNMTDAWYELDITTFNSLNQVFYTIDLTMVRSIMSMTATSDRPGLYFIRGTGTTDINNSVMYDTCPPSKNRVFIYRESGAVINIKNSVIMFVSPTQITELSNSSTAWDIERNNCFFSLNGTLSDFPGGALDSTSFEENPLFVDHGGNDFRQTENSPTIGAGQV